MFWGWHGGHWWNSHEWEKFWFDVVGVMSFLQWENQMGVGDQGHDSAYSSGILSCHQLVTPTTKNYWFFSLLGVFWMSYMIILGLKIINYILRIVVMGPDWTPVRVPKTLIFGLYTMGRFYSIDFSTTFTYHQCTKNEKWIIFNIFKQYK